MRRRLTRRFAGGVLAGVALVGAAVSAQAAWLFILGSATAGLALSSLALAPRGPLTVTRTAPQRAIVGDTVTVVLTLQPRRRLGLVRLTDAHPSADPVSVLAGAVGARAVGSVAVDEVVRHRGQFTGGRVALESGYPFGFIRASADIEVTSAMLVAPRLVRLPPPTQSAARARAAAGGTATRRALSGDLHAVRDYRRGDPLHHVHWRTSARAGRLVVRELERPDDSGVLLVVAGLPGPAYEAALVGGLSLARAAVRAGRRVSLARPGDVSLAPNETVLLDWAAGADAADADLNSLVGELLARDPTVGTVVLAASASSGAGRTLDAAATRARRAGAVPRLVRGTDEPSPDSDAVWPDAPIAERLARRW